MAVDRLATLKRAAARAAAREVRSGMLVGLGTGSTAAFLIEALAEQVREGLAIRTVATSIATADHAARLGLAPLDMEDIARVDLCIDGVDEIDPALRAIKGGGGAMLREKIVAAAATRMIAIADGSKQVARLGARPVPIEVLPFARASVERRVVGLGGRASPRPTTSDQRNLLIDCDFGPIGSAEPLASALAAIPGMLGHGLFLDEIDALYLATEKGVAIHERNASVTKL